MLNKCYVLYVVIMLISAIFSHCIKSGMNERNREMLFGFAAIKRTIFSHCINTTINDRNKELSLGFATMNKVAVLCFHTLCLSVLIQCNK